MVDIEECGTISSRIPERFQAVGGIAHAESMDIPRSVSTKCIAVPTVASVIPFFQTWMQNVRAAKETMPTFRNLGFIVSNIMILRRLTELRRCRFLTRCRRCGVETSRWAKMDATSSTGSAATMSQRKSLVFSLLWRCRHSNGVNSAARASRASIRERFVCVCLKA